MTLMDVDNLEAGNEMGVLVAERVMQWPRIGGNDPFRHYKNQSGVIVQNTPMVFSSTGVIPQNWRPWIETAHAWQVLYALIKRGWHPAIWYEPGVVWTCELLSFDKDKNPWVEASAETVMLAICRAALKAVE